MSKTLKKPHKNMFWGRWGLAIVLVMGLASTCVAQKSGNDPASLKYINSEAMMVSIFRPAKLLESSMVKEFRRESPKSADKMLSQWTDVFFKMCGSKLEEIDQITSANAHPETGDWTKNYSVIVIRTKEDNQVRFDMVTQTVDREIEFEGKTYFEMKRPVQYMKFCCICDEKTIAWCSNEYGAQQTIKAANSNFENREWYAVWKKHHAGKSISMVLDRPMMKELAAPAPFDQLSTARFGVANISLDRSVKATVMVATTDAAKARQFVQMGNQAVMMGKEALAAMPKNSQNPEMDAGLFMGKQALNALKLASEGKLAIAKTEFKVDMKVIKSLTEQTSEAARRTQSANNIRQIALAMHNYYSATGSFPPAVLTHKSGQKYSWRIAVLPYMEQMEIYEQYDFTQPWNSKHNREVTSVMPAFYRAGDADEDSTDACYFVLTGPATTFDGGEGCTFANISDGTSNTILAVESRQEIHWAEPRDIPFAKANFRSFGGFFEGGFNAALCDGSVRFLSDKVKPEKLYAMLTKAGGEVIDSSPDGIEE